jgi:hypothetical protein
VINNLPTSWPTHDFKAGADVSVMHAPSFFPRYPRRIGFTFSDRHGPFDPADLYDLPDPVHPGRQADPGGCGMTLGGGDDIYSLLSSRMHGEFGGNLSINAGIRLRPGRTGPAEINGV